MMQGNVLPCIIFGSDTSDVCGPRSRAEFRLKRNGNSARAKISAGEFTALTVGINGLLGVYPALPGLFPVSNNSVPHFS